MGYHVWLQYSVQGGLIILLWAVWGGPLLRGGHPLYDSATVCSCECVVLMEGGSMCACYVCVWGWVGAHEWLYNLDILLLKKLYL